MENWVQKTGKTFQTVLQIQIEVFLTFKTDNLSVEGVWQKTRQSALSRQKIAIGYESKQVHRAWQNEAPYNLRQPLAMSLPNSQITRDVRQHHSLLFRTPKSAPPKKHSKEPTDTAALVAKQMARFLDPKVIVSCYWRGPNYLIILATGKIICQQLLTLTPSWRC